MIQKISKWGTIIFSIFWLIFIILDYWANHSSYLLSFRYFQFAPLLFTVLVISTGISGWFTYKKKQQKIPLLFNGMGIYFIFLLLTIFSIGSEMSAVEIKNFRAAAYVSVLINMTFTIAAILLTIVIPAHNVGHYINNKLSIELKKSEQPIVFIAVGLVVQVLMLFILGALKLLTLPVVLPVLILPVAIFWRSSIAFIKKITTTRYSHISELNWIGICSFIFLLFLVQLSVVQLIRPYPFGFDSLSLYTNIASLIQDYQGLVEGFQPYNWSLLMSVGYTVFNMTEVALGLSMLGIILSLFALYQISRRWLNVNHALLTILLFYSLPSVVFQTYKDLKIDMGLLFIMLTSIIVFINWIEKIVQSESVIPSLQELTEAKETITKSTEVTFWQKNNLIVILGILAGFSLGIKFTALFLILGLLGGIWYVHNGRIGLVTIFFLSMFIVLLGRVDDMSGARNYHLSADVLQWILLLLGLVFMTMLYLRKREQLIKSIKVSILFVTFFTISFIHWPVKNYIETQQLTVRSLLFGKAVGPNVSPALIEQNWRKQQQNQQ